MSKAAIDQSIAFFGETERSQTAHVLFIPRKEDLTG